MTAAETKTTFPELLENLKVHLARSGMDLSEEKLLAAIELWMMQQAALCFAAGKLIRSAEELPKSKGYERLLIEGGWGPVWARTAAALAVRHGRRRATESKWMRGVCDAIRFLARAKRQERSICRRAKLILLASRNTSIVQTIFSDAGLEEHEFLRLLEWAVEGRGVECERIAAIATELTPHLSMARGPKVSAPSATHEFLLRQDLELTSRRARRSLANRAEPYVDALTRATRREFDNPDFDSRPARRRLNMPAKSSRRPFGYPSIDARAQPRDLPASD